jgi:glucose/mannose-6-phosphate isomerase
MLDDATAVREIDRSDLLSTLQKTPIRLAPPRDASLTCKGEFGKFDNVVFGGVGGSGIVGEILTDYCRASASVPVSVCRTLMIPKFVGNRTLFVAISYSGETQETLGQLDQAERQGAKVACITSGGRLLLHAEKVMQHVRVTSGMPPRLALPELVAATVFVMGSAGVLTDTSKVLSEAAKSLGSLIERIGPNVPSTRNEAKRFADLLVDKLPLIIGDEAYVSVLRRFKNELNENSKVPAFYYALPEGYHDDVEGLRAFRQLAQPQPIIFHPRNEGDRQTRSREQLARLLVELGYSPALEFDGSGNDMFSELLTAITFADYVSVYLAILRKVDPAELTLIPRFRKVMPGK